MTPRRVRLPDGRVWLRVADPSWSDPLDASWSRRKGGRWNPPDSHDSLYLNADVRTCQMQLERMVVDSPVTVEDLDDAAFDLVALTLPRNQVVADAVSDSGLKGLGLPGSYPVDRSGAIIARSRCQPVGARIRAAGLRGLWCRSAASRDGMGRELAWFPAGPRSRAYTVWDKPSPLGDWRGADGWAALNLPDQPDPDL